MPDTVLVFLFACLLLGASLLAAEVITGRTAPEAQPARWIRAGAFALPTVAGGILLMALPLTEWVLLLALLPLTSASFVRFVTLVPLAGWRRPLIVTVVVCVGVVGGASFVPVPLHRGDIETALPGPPAPPPSAHPNADRLVRT
jgi:hypothetical protein